MGRTSWIEGPALFYVFLKEEEIELTIKTNISKSMLNSHEMVINNTYLSQDLESLAILYSVNQPVNS